ncbi:MAG TPA: glycosyltransferase family 2 protein [Acidimicrobiales bacterium]|nr:glycosyltransferase family 2 protein [Acidimicrobiales bacterium]
MGAVVVSYNAAPLLGDCLQSLRDEGVEEIVVVDNASVDGSPAVARQTVPPATVIDAGRNLGYGAGANRGLAAVTAPMVLVMNPDVVLQPGSVATLVADLDTHAGTAVVGPALENPDGSLYPSVRRFPSVVDSVGHGFLGLIWRRNRFSRNYLMLEWDHTTAREADWVSGACFLARTDALRQVGGFDEDFFMYSEDVDLCWRLGRHGWSVRYQPAARVLHLQGASSARHPYRMLVAHHVSLLRFANRTTTGSRRALLPVVAAGLATRAGLLAARQALGRSRWAPGPAGSAE